MVFTNEPSKAQGAALVAVCAFFMILPYPFVLLRLWARRFAGIRLTWNDFFIIIALIFSTALAIDLIWGSILGGYLTGGDDVPASTLVRFGKAVFAATVLWPTANAAVKLAFLHFYYTLFSCNKATSVAIYAVAVVSIGYWLGAVITAFALCTPLAYNWNKTIDAHCGNIVASYLAVAIVNLLNDVMIIALPMPMLWSLQMRTSRKIALTFIFGLGAIICAISIARCVAIARLTVAHSTQWEVIDDITTVMEPTLGIVNSCLPTLGPLSKKWFSSNTRLGSRTPFMQNGPDEAASSQQDGPVPKKHRLHHKTLDSVALDSTERLNP